MHIAQEKILQPGSQLEAGSRSMFDVSHRSIVSLGGKDGLDLIQRLSTNEVSKLEPGTSAQTILTNDKGKIVDALSILKLSDDHLLLVGNTTGDILRSWIEKYIIMEDAFVEDKTTEYTHLLLYGREGIPDGVDKIKDSYTLTENWNGCLLYHVLCPVPKRSDVLGLLEEVGYKLESEEHFTRHRIENRIPAYPTELSVQYNPMEAGLIDQISFTKGCYIGQEVIARLDTYNKVQRKLVKLELGAPLELVPSPIHDDKGEVGTLTSIDTSDKSVPVKALGYIKTSVINENRPIFFLKNITRTSIKVIS